MRPFRTEDQTKKLIYITVCLRRAGEIHPDKIAIEENNENKFGQLMRNKTLHPLVLFLVVYIGVEGTIGGIVFRQLERHTLNSLNLKIKIRMDCNISVASSWRWAFVRLRFDWILRW